MFNTTTTQSTNTQTVSKKEPIVLNDGKDKRSDFVRFVKLTQNFIERVPEEQNCS